MEVTAVSPTTPPRLTVGTTIAQPVSVWNPLQPLTQQLPRPLLSPALTQLTHQDAIIGYVILSSNLVVEVGWFETYDIPHSLCV